MQFKVVTFPQVTSASLTYLKAIQNLKFKKKDQMKRELLSYLWDNKIYHGGKLLEVPLKSMQFFTTHSEPCLWSMWKDAKLSFQIS